MLTGTKNDKPQDKYVLFHLVLKAYPKWDSWVITSHISLGDLNKHLCIFDHQKASAYQLLMKLQWQPFTSSFVFNALLGEFPNIDSIHQSYRPTIWMPVQLLWTEPVLDKLSPANCPWPMRSLLPFLRDALQWLTGTATTKEMWEIKHCINQLMQEQTKQETLVHIISILNITWYATQVNWQKINEVVDALQLANADVKALFNMTDILIQDFRYQQIYTYAQYQY